MDALKSDDHRAALEALRDLLAEDLAAARRAGTGTVAQIAAQYRATLAELAALPPSDRQRDTVDELKAARAKRRAG